MRSASDGPLLCEKAIDVPGRFSKSALSLQVRAGRGNSIALGIENRDVITVVVRLVKYKLVTVIPMGAGGHVDILNGTRIRHRIVPPSNYLIPSVARPCRGDDRINLFRNAAIGGGKRSLWVILDRSGYYCVLVDVGFAPSARAEKASFALVYCRTSPRSGDSYPAVIVRR